MAFTFKEFKSKQISSLPHYLLIGHPISHSLSPLMHQTALDYHDLNAHYYAVDLLNEDITDFISWFNRDSFLGCNITLPYKKLFIDVVDQLEPLAESVGAINTITKTQSKLIGFNTDVYGFLHPLRQYREKLEGSTAIVYGTGGASKAVKSGLISLGIRKILFVTRSVDNKIDIDLSGESIDIQYIDYSQWPAFIDDVSIVINATPLGMLTNRQLSPVKIDEYDLLKDKICYDLVYNPLDTTFLKNARKAGGLTINGLHMLIHQGDQSFNLWTGKSFPLEIIYKKLESYFMS